jgi:hypothetical protein
MNWTEAQEAAYRKRVGDIGDRYHSYCLSIEKHRNFGRLPIYRREMFHTDFLRGYWAGEAQSCPPTVPRV